jgi:hypothetical protein
VLWNTVYLERAIQALRDAGLVTDGKLLPHLSPLGWEHINLTGDYLAAAQAGRAGESPAATGARRRLAYDFSVS